ncbi:MAG: hypothetical protein OEW37_03165 [Rhodospirillaceae bacterium]|nr:hypothetical protein [Rhodospirillaceae bacterium]
MYRYRRAWYLYDGGLGGGQASISMWPPMAWFYWPLFAGMVLVVFFDRCGIARVLVKMPWNRDVTLR